MISAPWQKPFRGMQIDKTHPLSRGLVGCWIFNEKIGDKVFDLSGHGNYGTIVSADWVPGGLDFNGVSDHVNVGDVEIIDGATSFTILHKLKLNSLTSDDSFVRKWSAGKQAYFTSISSDTDDFRLNVNNDAQNALLEVRSTNAFLTTGVDYNLVGIWHGGNNVSMYKDGVALGTTIISNNSPASVANVAEELGIGSKLDDGSATNSIDGIIYYAMIWNRALSPYEVAWLNREPYAMFQQPISPASLYYDTAPPATAYPVFIHHQNQLRA